MNDSDCLARVLAGDKDAFDHIVRSYHRRLYYYVAGKVADVSSTEDLVQKTFVSAFQSLMSYDARRPLFEWLCGIALKVVYRCLHYTEPRPDGRSDAARQC